MAITGWLLACALGLVVWKLCLRLGEQDKTIRDLEELLGRDD